MKRFRRGFPRGDRELVVPQAAYERFYAEDLHRQDGTYRPWQKQPGKFLWYCAIALAAPKVLDIGCGGGHLAAMYASFGRKADYAGGIDYCPSAIAIARHQAPWAHFGVGDACGHPDLLARRHYRTAVILETLEHIYEDLKLLAMIPRGRIVVASVPSFSVDGHCRWFAHVKQVKERYGQILKLDRVFVEEGLASDNRWFVFRGKRV